MKKVLGIAKEMIRVVCVCFVFPGVDVSFDDISCYFTNAGMEVK